MTVKLLPLADADAHRSGFAVRAVEKLQLVINDPRFRTKLDSAQYVGRRFETAEGRMIDASNDLVRDIITGGKERGTSPDGVIELQVRFARLLRRGTLGFVLPSSPIITTNTRFFDLWQPDDYLSLAAHWMHEWMHVAGFRHGDGAADVAYSIGDFVIEIGRALARDEKSSAHLLEQLGRGYKDATSSDSVDCPVFEDGVPEEYTGTTE